APNAQQLKSAASAGYKAAEASPNLVAGDAVANMATGIKDTLENGKGFIAARAPQTHSIIDELGAPPSGNGIFSASGNYSGLAAARERLAEVASEGGNNGLPTPDAAAAKIAME